jgi:hypothetical protein
MTLTLGEVRFEPAKPSGKQASTGALTAVPEAMVRLAVVRGSFGGSGRAGSAVPSLSAAAADRKLGLAHLGRGRFDRLAGTVLCGRQGGGPHIARSIAQPARITSAMCS